ncbi:hypothetical protein BGZ65_002910 [Modicella reniformis]|uniref:Uncharacterized protein n=1 Tax=Modicella reniformis TaxID=1440133 RepID=A0A9P6MBP8_9FUNG|nr:hypothetical protein BGZ65_002910 [Modicella reniformis]
MAALDTFYNGNNNNNTFKRKQWDSWKAYQAEYYAVADGLLRMIGDTVGEKRSDSNKAIITVGLGRFGSQKGPYITTWEIHEKSRQEQWLA